MAILADDNARVEMSGSWARWKRTDEPYTVGIEEEVMLLEPRDLSLAQRSDRVIGQLQHGLSEHTSQETHAGVLELRTGVHLDVARAAAELVALRRRLALELASGGTWTACAGMHPLAPARATRISETPRYHTIADSMRCLALGEPTTAVHVHVAVLDPDDATRVLRRIRENVPLLVALSANSPFSGGRDSGFASARTVTFDAFPRTGLPRAFGDYEEYVEAIDALIVSGLIADPTFLWWDVRLQPALGTVEVRVMDAQSTVAEIAPLVALVQSLARLELEDHPSHSSVSAEVLAENRFLAARDGLDARVIDPATGRLVPIRDLLGRLIGTCRPHAAALGCATELDLADHLIAANGAIRQRNWVAAGQDLPGVLAKLVQQFTAPLESIDLLPLVA